MWAFRKLTQFVEYKPEEQEWGVFVDTVNPKNTSKRCNECGYVHDDDRHRDEFECQQCGKQNRADYNAVSGLRPAGSKVTA
jgi:Transposase and inactivated derivatives